MRNTYTPSSFLSDDKNFLCILDQSKLPQEEYVLSIQTSDALIDAIKKLKVRGAPAIGVASALGIAVIAKHKIGRDAAELAAEIDEISQARPTAVNLSKACERMQEVLHAHDTNTIDGSLIDKLFFEAQSIYDEEYEQSRRIAEAGLPLIKPGSKILTHCNAGRLATVDYGTALAPLYLAHERGIDFEVFADETRPLLQGARLTAYELTKAGIKTTVLGDSMSSLAIETHGIDLIIVGADRIAANGDSANKIGTNNLAIVAKHYQVPFYVAAPRSTFDLSLKTGAEIPIEMRDPQELSDMWYKQTMIPNEAEIFNPAFDVTSADLISGFITDFGLITSDFEANFKAKVSLES
ncbi:MAG: S-methyl-5-thioribose-1-phosphate isomerase [Coriobacteriia bacterium]|nr:S-methyl-5-thioribose-1-phosphate isomerase [Coriobacteriia bacterium]